MLLLDYMQTQIDINRVNSERYRWANIKCWSYGERYRLHLFDGVSVDFDDLATSVEVLRSEFEANEGHVPLLQFDAMSTIHAVDYGKKFRKGTTKADHGGKVKIDNANVIHLAVIPAQAGDAVPMPPIEHFLEQITLAVTMYNLTQSWDQMSGTRNL